MYIDTGKITNILLFALLSIIAFICICFSIHYLVTSYKPDIDGNEIIILTGKNGDEHIYKDELPPYKQRLGKEKTVIKCFYDVPINDTVAVIIGNGVYYVTYHIVCHINRDKCNDYNIDIIKNINDDMSGYILGIKDDIRYLCISIPANHEGNAENYMDTQLEDDMKWIVKHSGMIITEAEIDINKKENP